MCGREARDLLVAEVDIHDFTGELAIARASRVVVTSLDCSVSSTKDFVQLYGNGQINSPITSQKITR